jgi:hypothetical protein
VAGIPWGKYDRSDWERVPKGQAGFSATARTFRLKQRHDVVISRRQFDENYGSASFFGTYEKKAKRNESNALQLLRPARGRKSALKLSPVERESEIGKRKVIKQETQQEKLIRRLSNKKPRTPQKITLKNFQKNKLIRRIRTGVDVDEIERLRYEASKSKIVFGYWVGLEMVSERDGQMKTPSLFSQRDIQLPFTDLDMDNALDVALSKSYAELTGMFIAFHLTKAAAKRNGVKFK